MATTSENYNVNTQKINNIVDDFSATSEEVLASMQNMVKAIDQIATTANEEARGAANIANEVTTIVQMSNSVIKLAQAAKEKSDMLIETVSRFKV